MSKLRRSKLTLDCLYQSRRELWISASSLQSSVGWMRLEMDRLISNHSRKDSMLLGFSRRKLIINACRNSTVKVEMNWSTMEIFSKMSGKRVWTVLWFYIGYLWKEALENNWKYLLLFLKIEYPWTTVESRLSWKCSI